MKNNTPFPENKYDIYIYAILIIASTLIAFHVVSNIKISPDGMRFGLISEQILSGNGIRVPLIRLEDSYVPVNGAIPFLDQLPLVPLLFAAMGGLTHESYLPAQALNLISHVSIAIFSFLLMRKICGKKSLALLTGLLVSFSYPLLWAAHHICTEPLFIAITVATIYFLTLSRNSRDSQFKRNFLAAGLFASAAILTRNAGIAIIPVIIWEALILVRNKRPEFKQLSTILAIILPVISVVSLFVRNYIYSGSLRGFKQASPERSLPEAFAGTMKMVFDQFHLGGNAIILIVLSTLFIICFIFINADFRKKLLKSVTEGLDFSIVFMVSYTVLICLTMATQQWHYELRFVFPLVPFMYITILHVIVLMWDSIKERAYKLSLAGMILSVGILALGSSYKTIVNIQEFSYKQEKAYALLHSCAFDWLKKNYNEEIMIVTNRPFHLGFFGGYPTVALPHKRFNPTINVPDDMESVLPESMGRFGAKVLALFIESDESYEGKYISNLFHKRESNDIFSLVYECSGGVVYTLKE